LFEKLAPIQGIVHAAIKSQSQRRRKETSPRGM